MKKILFLISVLFGVYLISFNNANATETISEVYTISDQTLELDSDKSFGKLEIYGNVVIDLKGFTITNTTIFIGENITNTSNTGSLTIKDSVGDGQIIGNSTDTNSIILVHYRSELILEGGVLKNNTATNGGAIYLYAQAKFTMSGGEIKNNKASGASTTGRGGAVYMSDTSEFYMESGMIYSNTSTNHGGAVYIGAQAIFSLSGGNFINNTSEKRGGAIYASYTGKFNGLGGTITDNTAAENGSGVYNSSGIIKLAGNIVINDNDKDNIYSNTTIGIMENELFEGKIGINFNKTPTLDNDIEIIKLGTNSSVSDSSIINSDNPNYVIIKKDNSFYLKYTHYHNQDERFMTNLTQTEGTLTDGWYYLNNNLVLTNTLSISGDVHICLNGYILCGNGSKSVFNVTENSSLNIYSCNSSTSHNYKIDPVTKSYIFYENNSFVTNTTSIKGGIITSGNGTLSESAIKVNNNAELILNSGSILGCRSNTSGAAISVIGGRLVMNDGSISNNSIINTNSSKGGAIYLEDSSFELNNGVINNNTIWSISGKTSFGGAIYVDESSSITINNGSISANSATFGGAIYNKGTLTINNSTISNNIEKNSSSMIYSSVITDGAGIYNDGTLYLLGGNITNNTCNNSGGGIYTATTSQTNISGNIKITKNHSENSSNNNLFLNTKIIFTNEFTGTIGITLAIDSGLFTQNYSNYFDSIIPNITSDLDNKALHFGNEGELYILSKTIVSNVSMADWVYKDNPNTPSAITNYGQIKYSYSDTYNGEYTDTIPTQAGLYYVKAYVEAYISEDISYTYAEAINSFYITKKIIQVPTIESKTYNGITLIADIEESEHYLVIENNGGINAENYPVILELKDSSNYQWSNSISAQTSLIFTINSKTVNVLWKNLDFVYDSNSHIPTASIEGLVINDTCNFTISSSQINAGNYTATITLKNNNYIAKNPTVTFKINTAETEITNLILEDWEYGKVPNLPSATTNFGTIIYSYSENSIDYNLNQPTEAGHYYLRAYVAGNSNYTNATKYIEFNIIPRPITVKIDNKTRIYDAPDVELTHLITSGSILDNDIVNITISRDPGTDAGSYAIKGTYDNSNYNVAFIEGVYTITPAANSISNLKINNWNYGYTPATPTANSIYGEITFEYSTSLTGEFTSSIPVNAGHYYLKAFVLEHNNYTGTEEIIEFDIFTRKMTIKINNLTSTYNSPLINLTSIITSGQIVENDDINLVLHKQEGLDVGQYTITGSYNNPNYEITFINGIYTITQAKTNITNVSIENWVYGDESKVPVGSTNFGTIQFQYAVKNTNSFTSIKPTDANAYVLKAYVQETNNYSAAEILYDFQIEKREVQVLIDNKTSIYNDNLVDLSFTVLNDLPSIDLEISVIKENGYSAGIYTISGLWNNNPNFNVVFTNGTYTITQAKTIVSNATIDGWTYGQVPNKPSASSNFGTIVYSYSTNPKGEFSQTVPSNAGRYYMKAEVLETNNYSGANQIVIFDILKDTIDTSNLSLPNLTVIYDGNSHSLTVAGNIHNDITIEYINNDQINPGVYEVTANLIVSDNYHPLSSLSGILTILQSNLIDEEMDDVLITSDSGFAPDVKVTVNTIEEINDYSTYLDKFEQIIKVYDISLFKNESSIQPNSEITIKILIPELVLDTDFEIIHIHNGQAERIEYEKDGEYAIVKTNKLSAFIFTYRETPLTWVIILLSTLLVIAIVGFGLQSYILTKNIITERKEKKDSVQIKTEELTSEEDPISYDDEDENDFEENNTNMEGTFEEESHTTRNTKLYSSILPLAFIFYNPGQLHAIKIISIILGVFIILNILFFIYTKFLKGKIRESLTRFINKFRYKDDKNPEPTQEYVYEGYVYNSGPSYVTNEFFKTHHVDDPAYQITFEELYQRFLALQQTSMSMNEDVKVIYRDGKTINISYDRSFKAKIIQGSKELQNYYELLKNKLLSYRHAKSRISWSNDAINVKGINIARFAIKGKTLNLYLALNFDSLDPELFKVQDASGVKKYSQVPTLIKIKNAKRLKEALALIELLSSQQNISLGKIQNENFHEDYQSTSALIKQGLIKVIESVEEPEVEQEIKIIYDRSFKAKLIQGNTNVQDFYEALKNQIHSYKDVKSRISWSCDSINYKGVNIAKFAIKGTSLYLYMALVPSEIDETKYKFKDESNVKKYVNVPVMLKLKNNKRFNEAKELLDYLAAKYELIYNTPAEENYHEEFQTTESLIEQGLIKTIEIVDDSTSQADPVHPEDSINETDSEEITTIKNGQIIIVTYNRSFTSKLIQSNETVQENYQLLKNTLHSFEEVKSRISWSCDSINANGKNIAKFSIRGKSLYIYLAINPNSLDSEKYSFKDVSDIKKYANVPVMLKLKTQKSVNQALDLIDDLCQTLELTAGKNPNVDYQQQYQSDDELIEEGLIKVIEIEKSTDEIDPDEQNPIKALIKSKISMSEAKTALSDTQANDLMLSAYEDIKTYSEGKKSIINIDTLAEHFSNGDIVDLNALKAHKLVSNGTSYVKILARGELDKRLIVMANDFSVDAIKMIVLTGGKAIKIKPIEDE